jgi:hypothetical protein
LVEPTASETLAHRDEKPIKLTIKRGGIVVAVATLQTRSLVPSLFTVEAFG